MSSWTCGDLLLHWMDTASKHGGLALHGCTKSLCQDPKPTSCRSHVWPVQPCSKCQWMGKVLISPPAAPAGSLAWLAREAGLELPTPSRGAECSHPAAAPAAGCALAGCSMVPAAQCAQLLCASDSGALRICSMLKWLLGCLKVECYCSTRRKADSVK